MLVSGMCFFWRTVGSNRSKDDWFYDILWWFMLLIHWFNSNHHFFQVFINDTEIYGCLYGLLFFLHYFASQNPWVQFCVTPRRHWTDKFPEVLLTMGLRAFVLMKGRCAQLSTESTHQIHGDSQCGVTTFNFNLFGRKAWWPPSFFLTAKVFRCNDPLFVGASAKERHTMDESFRCMAKCEPQSLVEASNSRVRVVYFVVFLLKLLKLLL